VDRHLEHLDAWVTLTPEQKALLHEALSQSRDEAGRLVQKLRERREELRELLSSVEVDSISIRSTVADISQLQSELDSLLMETLLREQLILRPEQRGAFGRWLARSRAERHMRMHKGDQSPGGDDPSSTKIDPPPGR
jgi:Spy/CpxP family protein refolding chaperone